MGLFDSLVKGISSVAGKLNSFENVAKNAPNKIGVYLMNYQGKVMYVGRGIENRPGQNPCGLRKRLQEHWRGASAGKPELYQHRYEITVSLKICETVDETREMEASLIRKYNTVEDGWNLRYEG